MSTQKTVRLGLAARMSEIAAFEAVELLTKARQLEAEGRSIIHMEVGEPDFPTPEPIIAAGMQALRQGNISYTPALGIPALREAISEWYATRYHVAVPPERIIVTTGGSGALLLALGVLLSPGDEVLMGDPCYPCNRHFVRTLEGRAVLIPTSPQTAYQLTSALVEEYWSPRTAVVMLASPSNPTGTMLTDAELQAIAALTQARGGRLIVDEIYHGLTYGCDAATALAYSDEIFVLNSFSKYFQMTGWRIGWLVAPQAYLRELEKLAQNLFISPPYLAQHAALAAFRPETLAITEARRAEFQRRRDFLLPALTQLGFVIPVAPTGAFYLYADCSRLRPDSFAFAEELLFHAGVAMTPGRDFGLAAPERRMRITYTTSMANLQEGVERIRRCVARR
ncbi:MAG TPA: pyridoxal phosphate-dependent aminotransferase [Methylomirabilota bacterium]|nr:pyridoxal phosphate-dependent aminotransferase [Methylomirabilota bacterium]